MKARFSDHSKAKLLVASVSLAGALLAPALAQAAGRPPKGLHLSGEHWTAWNPPAPAAGVQVHVVAQGDTLWELAKKYYGNPYLWPQLWEKNQYVEDAHWIYPGDPLVLGLQVAPGENLAHTGGAGGGAGGTAAPAASGETPTPTTDVTAKEPGGKPSTPAKPEGKPAAPGPDIKGVLSAGAAAGSPIPLGFESDIDCTGYVGELDETFPYAIAGSEYDVLSPPLERASGRITQGIYGPVGAVKYGLTAADIIYLSAGRNGGLTPGAVFTIVEPRQVVKHPRSGQVFGRYYHYLGRVRVLSVQDESSIAEITYSCDEAIVGSRLKPYVQEPVPLARPTTMRPVNYPTPLAKLADAPTILMSRDDIVSLGEDHVVWIDRGANADVTPGDVYTIYRVNRPGLEPVVLGELAVLSVHARSSLAKIVRSRYTIYVGDLLDRK